MKKTNKGTWTRKKDKKKNMEKKKCEINGYFTVEASLILPAVILLIAFLFYLTFFLYNRCALSQDAYAFAFRGSLWCGRNAEEIKGDVEDRMRKQSKAKYVGLGRMEREAAVDRKEVTVKVSGGMRIPAQWQFTVEKQARRICPVETIRRARLIRKALEKAGTANRNGQAEQETKLWE